MYLLRTVREDVGIILQFAGSLPLIIEVVLRLAPMEARSGSGRESPLLETDAPLHHEAVGAALPLAPQAVGGVAGRWLWSLETLSGDWRVRIDARHAPSQRHRVLVREGLERFDKVEFISWHQDLLREQRRIIPNTLFLLFLI